MATALLLLLATAAAGARLGPLARRDAGDIFTLTGEYESDADGEKRAEKLHMRGMQCSAMRRARREGSGERVTRNVRLRMSL
ncbi:Uncharacterized protein OBRU01_16308 [Operophtera brumata]|uniref:Uncharacterized protein n=1 Tax=Operophtera brumata TaxID=104452 RepID=A0A0L7L2R5_OPEBR|nr:Uncharacterized protein OBRU01_16308 [Operophtera brumata]